MTANETISSAELLRLASETEGPRDTLRVKHRKPQIRLGVEVEDGKGYLALTDHETGARVTITMSLEALASMGGLMIMADNPGKVAFGCWLEGELQVVR
jgi:hypothetical protein